MMKSLDPIVLQLQAKIRGHELEMAALRASLDVQLKRIAQMQAELDVLPHARKRRASLRAILDPVPSHNGNGRTHR